MKAMILAAGLGTRLRPLTLVKPKALMPVCNQPAIARIIDYLKKQGVTAIVVNAHHHHDQILKYVDGGKPFGLQIEVRVEPKILGTGGGIGNTSDFWGDDPFIVINGDVLTNCDLSKAIEAHRSSGAMATMILHDCEPFNQITIDSDSNIVDIAIGNRPGGLGFTGIHIIEPRLLSRIPKGIFSSIIDHYKSLIGTGESMKGYVAGEIEWRDIGTIESYILANKEALNNRSFLIGKGCSIPDSARFSDWSIIGENTTIGKHAQITRSIIWENVRVEEGVKIADSIVTTSKVITSDVIEAIV